MHRWIGLAVLACLASLNGCKKDAERTGEARAATGETEKGTSGMADKVQKSDAEWRKQLTPEQYEVLRKKGTERAFTGKYWNTKEPGMYRCAGCGAILFSSDSKFESGCGWPSFSAPADGKAVDEATDDTHGMHRTEVMCRRCGGHLGHVFDDGPGPTHLRYCINSASIDLEKKPDAAEKSDKKP